jgi:hypothetical protein
MVENDPQLADWEGEEGLDRIRPELGPGALADLTEGLLDRERLSVRAVARHGIERIAEREDLRAKGNLFAGETTRVPLAVPTLVVGMDDLACTL